MGMGDAGEEEEEWPLAFAPGAYESERYVLLEVDDELLEALEAGTLVIQAPRDDADAVVCTVDKTFELKKVETSNMLLLAPPAGDVRGIRVEATASSHLEGIRCRPDFQPLRDMLRSTSYPNEVHAIGSGSQSRGFTFSQLQDALGASAEEIRDALRAEGAVQVQETWFGLKPEFKAELVRMILLSCEAEGWHLTSVTDTEMRDVLEKDGYEGDIVEQVLHMVSLPTQEPSGSLSIQAGPCCKAVARAMLQSRSEWPADEFFSAWSSEMPAGLVPDRSMLAGEALVLPTGAGERVVRLSSADLPLDAKARFRSLFSAKEFWQMSELRPYLGDVVGPGESEDAVLLRHARATMGNGGEEYFSARYDWD